MGSLILNALLKVIAANPALLEEVIESLLKAIVAHISATKA